MLNVYEGRYCFDVFLLSWLLMLVCYAEKREPDRGRGRHICVPSVSRLTCSVSSEQRADGACGVNGAVTFADSAASDPCSCVGCSSASQSLSSFSRRPGLITFRRLANTALLRKRLHSLHPLRGQKLSISMLACFESPVHYRMRHTVLSRCFAILARPTVCFETVSAV